MKRFRRQWITLATIALGVGLCSGQEAKSGSSATAAATDSDNAKKASDDSTQIEAAVSAATPLLDDADKCQETISAVTTLTDPSGKPALDDKRANCSSRLQGKLSGRTIPPGSQPVTFDLGMGNQAINVDG